MALTQTFTVGLDDRGILFEDGLPTRVLPPGQHRFFGWQGATVQVLPMATPPGDLPAAVVKLLGADLITVDISDDERGVVFERGVASRRLPPGRHLLWTLKEPRVVKHSLVEARIDLRSMPPAVRTLLAEDITTVDVAEEERVVLLQDSIAVLVLPAGRHAFWKVKNTAVVRYDLKQLTVELPPAQAALLQADVDAVTIGATERGLVSRRGKPARLLGSGRHTVWKQADVDVTVIPMAGITATPLPAEVRALMAAADYIETTVPDGAMGIRFVDGAIESTLPPGRHAAFTIEHQVSIVSIDLRERVVAVQGQDILTKDKVTLRLNASMTYRVTDVVKLAKGAKNADEILYLAVQLGLREQVAVHTLDEILSERSVLTAAVRPQAADRAKDLGLELLDFGVRDIILPGEMKTLLNKVIEAQKTAEANVILRREETAAVRSMAQTAKLLAENPVLMRLKELESYQELASKVATLNVVVSGDGAPRVELKL